jgi:succinate dehydrogenase/fumarate reductase flavoprotein subunit
MDQIFHESIFAVQRISDAMSTSLSQPPPRGGVEHFDAEYDIVVIGYGFAGGAAAISAADHGCSVLLAEKMPDPGGISITAGGGVRLALDEDDAFAYLQASNAGRTPDAVLRRMARGFTTIEAFMRELAAVNAAEVSVSLREGNYPYPGFKTWGMLEIDSIPGFDPRSFYPHVRGRHKGPNLFRVVQQNVEQRPIDVRLDTPALRLIAAGGEVRGATLEHGGRPWRVKARRGVVLACGGFEANPDMQKQYWQLQPVYSAVTRGNTGDGIRMALDVGADLWHMWHFHGSYGFRHPDPDYPTAIRMKRLPDWTPGGELEPRVQMSWILVDRYGKRYMNECPPYAQDTGHRGMDFYDPAIQDFPRLPSYVIFDEEGRRMYPVAQAVYNDRNASQFTWSDDNLREVEQGILKRADSVAELARFVGCEPAVLEASIARWNEQVDSGVDDDFARPAATMTPVRTPPFYLGEVWPVVSNTQGGPVHDEHQRVLNPYGEPIPRLFEAGELGSIWGSLYLVGGNLSECFITGRVAAAGAAELPPWDGG